MTQIIIYYDLIAPMCVHIHYTLHLAVVVTDRGILYTMGDVHKPYSSIILKPFVCLCVCVCVCVCV